MWQDTVLLICSLVFGFLLIPQMRDMYREKTGMNILSCATTFAFLVVLSFVYATLNLPLAVLGGVIDAGAWAIITALSVKYRSQPRF
ncbi:MAG: hypothetical protein ACXVI1_11220 [Halobacteriota archaeon]